MISPHLTELLTNDLNAIVGFYDQMRNQNNKNTQKDKGSDSKFASMFTSQ